MCSWMSRSAAQTGVPLTWVCLTPASHPKEEESLIIYWGVNLFHVLKISIAGQKCLCWKVQKTKLLFTLHITSFYKSYFWSLHTVHSTFNWYKPVSYNTQLITLCCYCKSISWLKTWANEQQGTAIFLWHCFPVAEKALLQDTEALVNAWSRPAF